MRLKIILLALDWRDENDIFIWSFSYFETRTRLHNIILMFWDEIETKKIISHGRARKIRLTFMRVPGIKNYRWPLVQRAIKVAVFCCWWSCYFSKQLYITILSLHFYFRYCSRIWKLRNALMKREELIPEWKCFCAFFLFDLILRLLFLFSVSLAFTILDNLALKISQIFPSVKFWQSRDKRQDNTTMRHFLWWFVTGISLRRHIALIWATIVDSPMCEHELH